MSKELHLLRHAKSDWEAEHLRDFDRPLNDRGLRDAPRLAKRIAAEVPAVERIFSSPAVRAYQTALFFRDAWDVPWESFSLVPGLYEASAGDWQDVVGGISDAVERCLLVGHNPGISRFVEWLTGEAVTLKTTCLASVELNSDRWAELRPESGRLLDLYTP